MISNRIKIISGCIAMLLIGALYAWSVLSGPIGQELNFLSQADLSLVFSIAMASFCIGGLISGFMKLNGRGNWAIIIASILSLSGYVLSARATGLFELNLGYGFFVGMGTGLAYNYILSNASNLIPSKQGVLSGSLLFCFGLSSLLIGQIYARLIEGTGVSWRNFFIIYGIITFVFLILLKFLLPNQDLNLKSDYSDSKSLNSRQMLATKTFWALSFWQLLMSAVGLAIISQGANIVNESTFEISTGFIALSVGLLSIANGFGRILNGLLYDRRGYFLSMTFFTLVMMVGQFILLLNNNIKSFSLLLIGFILIGLAYGACSNNSSAFVHRIFGPQYYAINLSIINLNLLLASFGSTISGELFDTYGSYMQTFILSIVISVVCLLIVIIIKSLLRNDKLEVI